MNEWIADRTELVNKTYGDRLEIWLAVRLRWLQVRIHYLWMSDMWKCKNRLYRH